MQNNNSNKLTQTISSQHERSTMKKILFYCPEMEKMAKEVESSDGGIVID